MKVKALIHIHSKFSDGELFLEEIKEKAKNFGASIVLLADHLEKTDEQEKINEITKKCKQLSDDSFLIIPGFEIENEYHFIIYGSQEKFSVLAHASSYHKKPPREILKKIDGVEIWNARYDSRYAPNLRTLTYLKGEKLIAMAGADAHGEDSLKKIWLEMEVEKLEEKEIFKSFREKKFVVANGLFSLDINHPFNFLQKIFFIFINYFYSPIRIPLTYMAKKGIKFPKFLRKLFHKFY